jgi:mono/diheme cytochrome c family protein
MEPVPMRKLLSRVVIVTGALFVTSSVCAQDVAAGKKIAHAWCSTCHLVNPRTPTARDGKVPSFSSIARMNSTTEMSLEAFLSTPHARMPNYSLSQKEIRNVSAYILSMRK